MSKVHSYPSFNSKIARIFFVALSLKITKNTFQMNSTIQKMLQSRHKLASKIQNLYIPYVFCIFNGQVTPNKDSQVS
jgi:hypothetical protein